jgi:hypothetical protein
MTSPAIRDAVKAELQAHWALCPFYDLSDYITLDEMPAGPTDKVLLLSFGFSSETMATIAIDNYHGWQEIGVFYLHLLFPAGDDAAEALAWGEQLRALFRGKRFGDVVIDSVPPFSDQDGAAIRLNGRWHGWSAPASFYRTICA